MMKQGKEGWKAGEWVRLCEWVYICSKIWLPLKALRLTKRINYTYQLHVSTTRINYTYQLHVSTTRRYNPDPA